MRAPWLPGEEHELLLHAALGRGEEVEASWRAWRQRVVLDDVDLASFRLLPLVWMNLVEHRVEDPELPRLKGIYRHAWARAQVQRHRLVEVLGLLHGAGVPTMLLKGMALLEGVYPSRAARPMDDVDVLVPVEAARRAVGLLVGRGWRILKNEPIPESRLALLHSLHLGAPEDIETDVDLHWRAVANRFHGREDFWDLAEPLEVGGVPTALPCPAHLLLHTLARAAGWSGSTPVRWVGDAVLLAARREIDWEELARAAEARHVTLTVLIGLRYVRDAFGVAVPAPVLARLERVFPPRYEQQELAERMRQTGPLQGLAFHWSHYRCLVGPAVYRPGLAGFARYLRDWWGLGSSWAVPVEALRRTLAGSRGKSGGAPAATPRADAA